MTVLYTKQGEKLRQWAAYADGAEVVVIHGQVGGKQVEKRYTSEPKNQGRANATTVEEQALLEAEAKVVKQLKSGYSKTKEEAEAFVSFFPMKAQNYLDYAHKVKYPCYVQPKLDGQRLMIDKDGNAWSKQGEPLELPEHWKNVKELAKTFGGLDGEIYAGLENRGGLSLQQIISAFRKQNKDTQKLKLFVYDLPLNNLTFNLRQAIMFQIEEEYDLSDIVIVDPTVVQNWEEAVSIAKSYVKQGYEGAILRNFDGMYEFGKRSYDLQKLKFRLDAEAVVVSVTKDKNGDGVLLCQAINGKQTGVQFECLMRKDADPNINYRKYSNALLLIGKAITYEYEELADDTDKGRGKPTKPVAVAVREMVGNEGRF